MSRPERKLQKRFVVFCEGDTEYNYIDKMRKQQDVQIALKPINMHGGGYTNFLKKIKMESQTNCLAKFIIVDADRLMKHYEEKDSFWQLAEYCKLQNKKGVIPHFLIVNNPDFEYAACLHVPEYRGQDVTRFLQTVLGFQSLEQFKKNTDVYGCLNSGERSYQILLERIKGKDKFIKNIYSVKKKNFEITINRTDIIWELLNRKDSNLEEFFDIIEW